MSYIHRIDIRTNTVPPYLRESQLRYAVNMIGGKFNKTRNWKPDPKLKDFVWHGPYNLRFSQWSDYKNISLDCAEQRMIDHIKCKIDELKKHHAKLSFNAAHSKPK